MAETAVAYGEIQNMIAEYGVLDMGETWFAENGFTHCVMILGDGQYDADFFKSAADACREAKLLAAHLNVARWAA
jgi:hypothetical protein